MDDYNDWLERQAALELGRDVTAGGEPALFASPRIVAMPDTIVACAKCHDVAAPEYRLRRVMGRYVLLCYRGGDGCWERSPQPMCTFKDEQGVSCGRPAEARVAYGEDQTVTEDVCCLHVGACLTPAHGKMTVYALEV